jgi:sialic acid synthase SpsE
MRDCYIANVLTQVIERHFLVNISDTAPDRRDYDEKSFKALVEENKGLEKQKDELRSKIEVLEECLDILEPYRSSSFGGDID